MYYLNTLIATFLFVKLNTVESHKKKRIILPIEDNLGTDHKHAIGPFIAITDSDQMPPISKRLKTHRKARTVAEEGDGGIDDITPMTINPMQFSRVPVIEDDDIASDIVSTVATRMPIIDNSVSTVATTIDDDDKQHSNSNALNINDDTPTANNFIVLSPRITTKTDTLESHDFQDFVTYQPGQKNQNIDVNETNLIVHKWDPLDPDNNNTQIRPFLKAPRPIELFSGTKKDEEDVRFW